METTAADAREAIAKSIADAMGLVVNVQFKGDRCPPWEKSGSGCVHGDRYRVSLRKAGRSLSFDLWNSFNDMRRHRAPGYLPAGRLR